MQKLGKSVFTSMLDASISRFQAERTLVQGPRGARFVPDRVFAADPAQRFTDRARQDDMERDSIRMAFGMGATTSTPSAN